MAATRLSDEAFAATFSEPMQDITATATAIVDIWPYVDELVVPDLALGDVAYVYESGDGVFHHVLLETGRQNIFMVIVVETAERRISGHHLLDLNEKYGLPANQP